MRVSSFDSERDEQDEGIKNDEEVKRWWASLHHLRLRVCGMGFPFFRNQEGGRAVKRAKRGRGDDPRVGGGKDALRAQSVTLKPLSSRTK